MRPVRMFLACSVRNACFSEKVDCDSLAHLFDEAKDKVDFDFTLFDPNVCSGIVTDTQERFYYDLQELIHSDLVIVDARDKRGIGVGVEIALAKAWHKPIYAVIPKYSHYRHNIIVDSVESEWIHPFISELIDRIFEDIEQLVCYLNEIYRNGRLFSYECIYDYDMLERFYGFDGGYDEGYMRTSHFWGIKPAEYVKRCGEQLKNSSQKVSCLDLGCGHGKNAIYLKRLGFEVDAIDSSYYAIKEARRSYPDVNWMVRDIRKICENGKLYDLIVMTGSLHCLASRCEVIDTIRKAQKRTKVGGYHVLSAFNNDCQDLSGHSKLFRPILLKHQEYMDMYSEWNIVEATNTMLEDVHPHNGVHHRHSITRIIAKKYNE